MRARCLTAALLLASLAATGRAGTGDLDPTFGSGGLVEDAPFSSDELGVGTLLVQGDGKIVAVGALDGPVNGDGFAVARYLSDGTLDPAFGTGGLTSVSLGDMGLVPTAVLQPDGKIVAANYIVNFAPPSIDSYVVRFDASGALDATFGSGGIAALDNVFVIALELQADGSILAGGAGDLFADTAALVRLLPDGTPDLGFGGDGFADLPAGFLQVGDLAIQSDGRILAIDVGFSSNKLARLEDDGTIDASFGTGGVVDPTCAGFCALSRLALQSDGMIVAAGAIDGDVLVARFDPDGAPDPAFGSAGAVQVDVDVHHIDADGGTALLVEPDGRIVVAGSSSSQGLSFDSDYFVARFDPDGSLDETFGAGGWSLIDFGTRDYGFALARQSDARLLVGGWADVDAVPGHFGIARLDGACPASPDADGDGRGDACDPCTDPAPLENGRLRMVRLLEPLGSQKVKAKGFVTVPGVPGVDPLSRGARLFVTAASGEPLVDLPLLGIRDDLTSQVGWTVASNKFAYAPNANIADVRGFVVRAKQIDLGGSRYKVTVVARDGALAVVPADLPLRLAIVFDARRSELGQCGEIEFAGPEPAPVCAFNATGTALRCR